MPVSELEKKADKMMSAAKTENKRPSGASFKSGVNPLSVWKAYLEQKTRREQVLAFLQTNFQTRCSISSKTNLEPK